MRDESGAQVRVRGVSRMNILSIQSEVVHGHVGQGAARLALERQGHEVWAIPTVLLSNHAAWPHVEGQPLEPDRLKRLVDGLAANGWLAQCDAVLSGYLGGPEQAEIIGEAVSRVKQANPNAIYCLDPVIGDDGRAYVRPGIAEAMARTLLPLADIVTPNAFELTQLSGLAIRDREEARHAIGRLGRPLVVATSIPGGTDRIGVLAERRSEGWFASTPRLDDVPKGAGDLFAALFLSARLSGADLSDALCRSTASVFHILFASRGCGEMRLIAEQDALVQPPAIPGLRLEQIS